MPRFKYVSNYGTPLEKYAIPFPKSTDLGKLYVYHPKYVTPTLMRLAWMNEFVYLYEDVQNPEHVEIIEKELWRLDYWKVIDIAKLLN